MRTINSCWNDDLGRSDKWDVIQIRTVNLGKPQNPINVIYIKNDR